MNTNDYRTAAAVVTGARHLRTARNGQDAVMTIVDGDIAVAVVCDGCSAGTSSEVGARLGARLFANELREALDHGERVDDERTWTAVRARVAAAVRRLVTIPMLSGRDSDADAASGRDSDACGPDSDAVSGRDSDAVSGRSSDALDVIDLAMLRECFLFTIIAAAITREGAAVWALGDGGFAIDGVTTRIGPFENNEPPYLAYDLLDTSIPGGVSDARPDGCRAHFASVPSARTIVVATDGAVELVDALPALEGNVACFGAARYLGHPDALRRDLARFARAEERIDWREQRVVRTPAVLQDDCAIAVLQRDALREAT